VAPWFLVRWIELAGAERQGRADGALGIPFESGERLGDGAPVTWDDKQITFYLAELEALAGLRQARTLARAQAKARSLTPRLLSAAEAVLATEEALADGPESSSSPVPGEGWLSREAAAQARVESRKAAMADRARERRQAERESFIRLLGRLTTITSGAHKKALHQVAFANQAGCRYCTAVTRAYRRTASGQDRRWRPWTPPQIRPAAPWKDAAEIPSYEVLLTEEAADLVRKAQECIVR
jgi:hypothetical protein